MLLVYVCYLYFPCCNTVSKNKVHIKVKNPTVKKQQNMHSASISTYYQVKDMPFTCSHAANLSKHFRINLLKPKGATVLHKTPFSQSHMIEIFWSYFQPCSSSSHTFWLDSFILNIDGVKVT